MLLSFSSVSTWAARRGQNRMFFLYIFFAKLDATYQAVLPAPLHILSLARSSSAPHHTHCHGISVSAAGGRGRK